MRLLQRLVLVLTLLAASTPTAFAVMPDEILSDSVLEARARALSKELRCMVCQNQSIDDSDAPLARDLRILVRERLQAGDSDQRVVDFLVARRYQIRARSGLAIPTEAKLTPAEEARLSEILHRGDA